MSEQNFFNYDSTGVNKLSFFSRDLFHISTACPGRDINQDSSALIEVNDDLGVIIVADGMGGYEKGERASRMAIEIVEKKLKLISSGKKNMDDVPTLVLEALDEAHQEIKNAKFQGGTTFSLSEIRSDFIRLYNLGDSFGLLLGSRGLVKYRTIDDSITGHGIESGLLSEEKALVHDEGHIITNALGLDDFRVEVSCRLIPAKTDFLFMASDGVSANLTTDQISEILASGPTEEKLKNLHQRVRELMLNESSKVGSPDDLTCFLLAPRQLRGEET